MLDFRQSSSCSYFTFTKMKIVGWFSQGFIQQYYGDMGRKIKRHTVWRVFHTGGQVELDSKLMKRGRRVRHNVWH